MKQITMPSAGATVAGRRSWIDDRARSVVLQKLGQLRSGRILLEDEQGTQWLGEGGERLGRVRVRHRNFYRRLLLRGSLGAAESFVEGEWTTEDLSTVLKIFARDLTRFEQMERGWAKLSGLAERLARLLHRNTLKGSVSNIRAHYDLGNSLFELFLDETMNYSAGIFEHREVSMKEASIAKMERVCRKLDLRPGEHLLEIGSGWGGLAVYAASRFGCRVTTTTISAEQHELAGQRVQEAGLDSRVRVLRQDYRTLAGRYDKLVSIEMIEAVGHEYLDGYFRQCRNLLKDDGLMLLQAIVTPEYRYLDSRDSVDFIRRYIFPGSCLTSIGQVSASIARVTDFSTLHVEDIGPHYAETLRRWRRAFLANIGRVRALGYGEDFIRMWEYYLCYCEAGFEERIIGDVQMLLGRPGNRRAPVLGDLGGVPDSAGETKRPSGPGECE